MRSRIDWKYLLCLKLTDPGFHYSVLSEFRARLVAGNAEQMLFEKLLALFQEKGLLKKRGNQRTDATHVIGNIRSLNRLELVGETLRHALNTLAVAAPAWLLLHNQPEWVERYGPRVNDYHLPGSKTERLDYAAQVGSDGLTVLLAIKLDILLSFVSIQLPLKLLKPGSPTVAMSQVSPQRDRNHHFPAI